LSRKKKQTEDIRLFGEWDYEGITVEDPGLKQYISFKPAIVPHTAGRHEHKRFQKSQVPIAERLVNELMRPGHAAGKKIRAMKIVENALRIVNLKTGENPLGLLVKAIENSAPREDTTRVSYGGVSYHVAVDLAPLRRVDLALRFIAEAARKSAFGNPKSVDEWLADEIIMASSADGRSYAISKKNEMERIAYSSR
jgi:small subunit ribosomal protein S7